MDEVKTKQKRTSVDYANGKIYMLEPTCEYDDGDVYYGSCASTLTQRLSKHKAPSNKCKSNILIKKYGRDNIKIVLIKPFQCSSKTELSAEESKYHRRFKCVNKRIEGRTKNEYYQDNREVFLEKAQQYRQDNIEVVLERDKQYSRQYRLKQKQIKQLQDELATMESQKDTPI
jgi:hypothetical protein